jgi:hypothetical protein
VIDVGDRLALHELVGLSGDVITDDADGTVRVFSMGDG